MCVTWQTELLLNEQLQITLLRILGGTFVPPLSVLEVSYVTLKPPPQELWLRFQCRLFSFMDIVLRVCTVTQEELKLN